MEEHVKQIQCTCILIVYARPLTQHMDGPFLS